MLEAKVVHLTPEIAEKWDALNTRNFRKLNMANVKRYAQEITSGNWQLNGETITFYEDGTLANGQHRIKAVIMAGKPIDVVVVWGIPQNTNIYDSGANRTPMQLANGRGISTSQPRLSTAAFILNEGPENKHGKGELIEYYMALSDYFDMAYKFANKGIDRQKILIKAGAISAIYCAIILNVMNMDKMEAFCNIVNSGMPYSNYVMEPAIVLRNMLTNSELGVNSGHVFLERCFNVTWQAIDRFNRQVKNKTRYKADADDYKTIIPKVKSITELLKKEVR